ncbi:PEP-CTERM protein-sorting domain-containing protein [Rubritalea squalenifaciens DSM 18772]|uniref:PEP-CTERM protein-sorting domain-containing protein n=1 Tax=Rubritalea squalenifaciens DSM 18772 TaxID=1123071 RepID=A0A1M6QHE0_9BACT|nr:PEP-CTERM sorting domain-containing protein [Rubritalea squalenifaciens]SHK19530.1 PEP-CTERM protein-sorting domain-containing protein [Rubritalea squalenifaciens DSM 18772]
MRNLTKISLALLLASSQSQAALTWTGNNNTLYAESNWEADGGGTPAADTINPGQAIDTAITGGLIIIGASGTGSPNNFGTNSFNIGDNDLILEAGQTLASSGSYGLVASNISHTFTIQGGSTVNLQFINTLTITLDGASSLTLRGGNSPLPGSSTVNFLDTDSTLSFLNEDLASFQAEHQSVITVGGNALVLGSDPYAIEAGDNAVLTSINGGLGTQVNAIAIPEPSNTALIGLTGLGFILRRRK